MRRGRWRGIDLFIDDGAYTTVASAVAMLVVLTLLFSSATAVWGAARSGEVQGAADATALAGANVVASYRTAATVLDATVLSMGLAGFCVTGAGLVGMLVPGAQAAAGETVDAGIRMLELRNDLAASASSGLSKLESALPALVAANATRVCAAQGSDTVSYTGTALAAPRESASRFPALAGSGVPTDGLKETSSRLEAAATELATAQEASADAKRAAWLADCGSEGRNMQERAASLTGLPASQNPDFASSITWEPEVALDRTRAYYRWRLERNAPEGSGAEAAADAAAREAFYRYALESFADARVEETDGGLASTVELLPRNTDEVRETDLYTEAIWYSTYEPEGLTLHYGASCPGATGAAGPALALSATEGGSARECPTCRFGVGDVGKAPAASTSIDNGFEYHLRAFTLALDDYVARRNVERELERAAMGEAGSAAQSFEEALSVLSGKRPRIAPPGRFGCIGIAISGESASPGELAGPFSPGILLGPRGAVAGAALAPDGSAGAGNVLSEFFSSVAERGGGPVGLIDDVMGLWGSLLVSYGDLSDSLGSVMDELIGGLSPAGLGPVAAWLGDRVDGAVSALGLEPVDLRLMKPVLADSQEVAARSGMTGLSDAQSLLRSLPLGTTDPAALLEAAGYGAVGELQGAVLTVAEIPLPGGGSVPITVRLRDLGGEGLQ